MRTAIAAIALVVSVLAARADTVPYSHSFQFDGTCTGGDMWNAWTVTGYGAPPDALIRPWHERPINVIGYELVKLAHTPAERSWWAWLFGEAEDRSWFMLGSTIQSDAMAWIAPGEWHGKTMFPAGLSQPFPSRSQAKPLQYFRNDKGEVYRVDGDLLDLHGHCPKGDVVSVMLTVYFTLADAATAER
jgi:hypothetical protein